MTVTPRQREAMVAHARRADPEECCGVLLGNETARGVRVTSVEPAANVDASDRRRRYTIDPRALLDAHRSARESGLEVVGYYHSHPRDPAVPSARDLDRALPGASYVIVSLVADEPSIRSWRLRADGESFIEESVSWRSTG